MADSWQALFDAGEPEATIALLHDPESFSTHAAALCEHLALYLEDHGKAPCNGWEDRAVRLTDAEALLGALVLLCGRASEGQDLSDAESDLRARYDAFLAEGWPYVHPLQSPAKRAAYEQRKAASRTSRARQLPRAEKLQAEFDELAKLKGERNVAAILAKSYQVDPAAVRRKLRRNKTKHNGR